jgi:hypothetical protein
MYTYMTIVLQVSAKLGHTFDKTKTQVVASACVTRCPCCCCRRLRQPSLAAKSPCVDSDAACQVGTYAYFAPERVDVLSYTANTDVWSLGEGQGSGCVSVCNRPIRRHAC